MKIDETRITELLATIEQMAGGDLSQRAAISPSGDELDAISYGVNALCGELAFALESQRRLRDAAEQTNRRKTHFVRTVSHELRTPLAAILALAQLLAQPELGGARRGELGERIASNGRSLLQLLDDLLDLAQIEDGQLELERRPVDLMAVCTEIIERFEPEAIKRRLQASVLAPVTLPAAFGDARRIRQILGNLVQHALKQTAQGEVRVTIALDDATLLVEVSGSPFALDGSTSPGPFAPLDLDGEAGARVHGIGLLLSRLLAEGMGGSLAVAPASGGQGSRLRLSLPALIALRAPAPQPSVIAPTFRPLADLRLLLVEDDEDIREAMAELLEVAGAAVEQVDDGDVAIEHASRSVYDAILMDIRMPRLDGIAATRALRAIGVETPIIILTADAVEEGRSQTLAAGGTEWLTKPIDLRHLASVLGRVVRRGARSVRVGDG